MKIPFHKILPILALASIGSVPATEINPDAAFREALYAEEVAGDPAAALTAYTQLLVQLEARRDLHATALFRQAECLRKLDKKAEAIAGYQKVLLLYPDVPRYQKECQRCLRDCHKITCAIIF